jgi:Amt family ammonium transporter
VINKSTFIFVVASVTFYGFGFGFSHHAYGGFIGTSNFFCQGLTSKDTSTLLFLISKLQVVNALISSSIIERTHLDVYLILAMFVSAVVWPIPVSWIWGNGWLQQYGALDHAGSGIVSVLGGVFGIIGTIIIGPRLGVFSDKLNLE